MSTEAVDMGTEQDVNRLVAEACGLAVYGYRDDYLRETALTRPCIRWYRPIPGWRLYPQGDVSGVPWEPACDQNMAIWAALRIGQVTTTHRIDGSVTATLEVDEGGGHRQICRGESDYSGASAVCLAILAWHQRETTR